MDVRQKDEVAAGRLPGAVHVFVGELPHKLDQITMDKTETTFCGSGQRAIIAASVVKQHGFDKV